ncbi:hypothetical protein FIBSPDRAFT_903253 [Athelia psychrophila]|uniref:Uncharacterized protein n=1 Tax=Athelia psychrophila TaxID=1759441 RepID=A0A167W8Z9_9AGAM|nr:hypothetical protein FIBSPDRAFT_903253 [Fibularhizoctonia sp. CBS 109695]
MTALAPHVPGAAPLGLDVPVPLVDVVPTPLTALLLVQGQVVRVPADGVAVVRSPVTVHARRQERVERSPVLAPYAGPVAVVGKTRARGVVAGEVGPRAVRGEVQATAPVPLVDRTPRVPAESIVAVAPTQRAVVGVLVQVVVGAEARPSTMVARAACLAAKALPAARAGAVAYAWDIACYPVLTAAVPAPVEVVVEHVGVEVAGVAALGAGVEVGLLAERVTATAVREVQEAGVAVARGRGTYAGASPVEGPRGAPVQGPGPTAVGVLAGQRRRVTEALHPAVLWVAGGVGLVPMAVYVLPGVETTAGDRVHGARRRLVERLDGLAAIVEPLAAPLVLVLGPVPAQAATGPPPAQDGAVALVHPAVATGVDAAPEQGARAPRTRRHGAARALVAREQTRVGALLELLRPVRARVQATAPSDTVLVGVAVPVLAPRALEARALLELGTPVQTPAVLLARIKRATTHN